MNEPGARESGLRLKATVAPRTDSVRANPRSSTARLPGLLAPRDQARRLPRHIALRQGYHGAVWLPLDAYWNLHATWFSTTTALKNEALSLGVRFSVA